MLGTGKGGTILKGQRLFVRLSTPSDAERIRAFYRSEGVEPPPEGAADGLIGFLVGETAAHLQFEARPAEVEILHLWVARELRRKRVARVMIAELADLARKLGVGRLTVRKRDGATEALVRLGFLETGEGSLERPVG